MLKVSDINIESAEWRAGWNRGFRLGLLIGLTVCAVITLWLH